MSDTEDRQKDILINLSFVGTIIPIISSIIPNSCAGKKQLPRQLRTTQTTYLEGGAQRDCEQRLTWSLTVVRHEITQLVMEYVELVCIVTSAHSG